MATLEKIRNQAGLLIAVVGIALFAFIIGDFLNSGSTYFGPSRERVGEVAGKDLNINNFQRDIATITDVMKMQYNQNPPEGEIRDIVWNSFVEQSLLNSETEKIGMSVTTAELKDATFGANMHPLVSQIPYFRNEQGAFDRNTMVSFFTYINKEDWTNEEKNAGLDAQAQQLHNYWLFWENRLKQQILAEKYQTLITRAMSASNAIAAITAGLNNVETDAACVRKMFYTIPDSTVSVTEAELQTKYNELKERMFKTDGFRSVQAITFNIVPSQEDFINAENLAKDTKAQLEQLPDEEIGLFVSQVTDPSVPFAPYFRTEKDIDQSFKNFAFTSPKGAIAEIMLQGEFYKTAKVMSDVELRPDSVKISHILIQRATEAEAQRVADSLVAVLNGGADFAALAAQYSADQGSIAAGGELGWFREGNVGVENFDNAVFTAKAGSVVAVTIPQQGVHVFKILERTVPVKKVKLAETAIRVEPSTATYNKIYNQANQFILANRTLESFEAAAKEQGLMIRPLDRLAKNQTSVYAFDQSRPIIRWAWENKVGTVSEVFEVPNMFVVAVVSQAVEAGFIPFKIVEEQVKAELLKDKKTELLISEIKGAGGLESLSPLDTLRNIRFSQSSFGNIGREPAVAAVAYATGANGISAPFRGNAGVYVLKALDKRDVPAETNSAEVQLMNDNIFSAVSRGLFESLKKNVKIEDNRFVFF
ncbi:MAG: SurA N-terminal domain-containing protein [Prevotellaceae bacterium]|jgi:peptidyl-prolyl cis-trans isomerase D|nr:SurA N-terminal domain-containing protein [Prevotellaceae bacterium]